MLSRKSIVDQIEVPTTGGIQVRIALQIIDGDVVIGQKWHRTYIPADISAQEQMSYVNAHLTEMGEATISTSDIQRVGLFHKLATDLPSDNSKAKTIDESVAEIKEARASTVVDAK